ncbi:MAG TPA: YraN family protein [Patescibacteria group bacterium]|nr:YraN family protein [Patescibacteria group bacterium]
MRTAMRKFGDEGEDAAAAFLARRGFRVLARNVRVPRVGELDLIALDGDELVFVEVKTRRDRSFGPPEEAVTPAKLRTIAACAEAWRNGRGWTDRPWRVDVVAVDASGRSPDIRHLRGVALD